MSECPSCKQPSMPDYPDAPILPMRHTVVRQCAACGFTQSRKIADDPVRDKRFIFKHGDSMMDT